MRGKGVFETVYKVARRVPRGRVATYGQISDELRRQNSAIKYRITPRIVGFALHANHNSRIPCHRVVNRNGRIAESYVFGGAQEQRRRLEGEGIEFMNEKHIDLENFLWRAR